jgi:hypothetical protein
VGDDPHVGAAVRQPGRHQRVDAGPRPRARRDDRRLLILSKPAPGSDFDPSLFAGGQTFASQIASSAAEFDTPLKTGAFIAAGLVLFLITFAVNAAARIVINRRREFV